jgi:hypothetical protein
MLAQLIASNIGNINIPFYWIWHDQSCPDFGYLVGAGLVPARFCISGINEPEALATAKIGFVLFSLFGTINHDMRQKTNIWPSLTLFEVALLYRRSAEIPGFDRIFKWPEAISIHRRLLWSPIIQCLFLSMAGGHNYS